MVLAAVTTGRGEINPKALSSAGLKSGANCVGSAVEAHLDSIPSGSTARANTDLLFEVTPLDSLRAVLNVPEDQIADVRVGLEGFLATASYPAERISFDVERIDPVAKVVDQRNVFEVRVRLLEIHDWMRPGMEGVGKITIGKRPYVWIWSRKIVNWFRMKLWF